jgi:hypothetical protein
MGQGSKSLVLFNIAGLLCPVTMQAIGHRGGVKQPTRENLFNMVAEILTILNRADAQGFETV